MVRFYKRSQYDFQPDEDNMCGIYIVIFDGRGTRRAVVDSSK
jgi:hypothetical protein